jgi:hypothetical protein
LTPVRRVSSRAFILVHQASEDRPAPDSLPVGVRAGLRSLEWIDLADLQRAATT